MRGCVNTPVSRAVVGRENTSLRPSRPRWAKRLFDVALASVGLLLSAPVWAVIAVAIKLDDGGPVFYAQERVGQGGRRFRSWKFRSMVPSADQIFGRLQAGERDTRVTRVGHVARAMALDELPQLWNILKGDMSFVGPRPERPFFVDLLKEKVPFYDLRHSVRPGITGWAQVSCHYGASVEDAQQKLEYDLFYIKNFSLSFDSLILFQTIKIVLFGRGAR